MLAHYRQPPPLYGRQSQPPHRVACCGGRFGQAAVAHSYGSALQPTPRAVPLHGSYAALDAAWPRQITAPAGGHDGQSSEPPANRCAWLPAGKASGDTSSPPRVAAEKTSGHVPTPSKLAPSEARRNLSSSMPSCRFGTAAQRRATDAPSSSDSRAATCLAAETALNSVGAGTRTSTGGRSSTIATAAAPDSVARGHQAIDGHSAAKGFPGPGWRRPASVLRDGERARVFTWSSKIAAALDESS
jgi:hypothetical protein